MAELLRQIIEKPQINIDQYKKKLQPKFVRNISSIFEFQDYSLVGLDQSIDFNCKGTFILHR